MPKVSVIMGVYNGKATMDEAIQSIVDQELQDWEFIICDDASTDDTYERLLQWAKKDSRIRIVQNKTNSRLAFSLNHCLQIADGQYIARMDDDDVSYPQRLRVMADFLDAHPQYDFAGSLVDCYDGRALVKNERMYRCEKPERKDFLSISPFLHPTVMFRKQALLDVGGYRVSKETRRTEDYDLFMRLYAHGKKGYNIQKALYRYYLAPQDMVKKRLYRYRIDEAIVRWKGFRSLGLLPKGLLYVVRPLIVGLIPQKLIWHLKYRKKDS